MGGVRAVVVLAVLVAGTSGLRGHTRKQHKARQRQLEQEQIPVDVTAPMMADVVPPATAAAAAAAAAAVVPGSSSSSTGVPAGGAGVSSPKDTAATKDGGEGKDGPTGKTQGKGEGSGPDAGAGSSDALVAQEVDGETLDAVLDAVDVHGNLNKDAPAASSSIYDGNEPPATDGKVNAVSPSRGSEKHSNQDAREMISTVDADVRPAASNFNAQPYVVNPSNTLGNMHVLPDTKAVIDRILKGKSRQRKQEGKARLLNTDLLKSVRDQVPSEEEEANLSLMSRLQRRSGVFGTERDSTVRTDMAYNPNINSNLNLNISPVLKEGALYPEWREPSHVYTAPAPAGLHQNECHNVEMTPYSGGWGVCEREGDTRPNTCPGCTACTPPCLGLFDCCYQGQWHHCKMTFQCSRGTHLPPAPYSDNDQPPTTHMATSMVASAAHVVGMITPVWMLPQGLEMCAANPCDAPIGCCQVNHACGSVQCPMGSHHIVAADHIICDSEPCRPTQCCQTCQYDQIKVTRVPPFQPIVSLNVASDIDNLHNEPDIRQLSSPAPETVANTVIDSIPSEDTENEPAVDIHVVAESHQRRVDNLVAEIKAEKQKQEQGQHRPDVVTTEATTAAQPPVVEPATSAYPTIEPPVDDRADQSVVEQPAESDDDEVEAQQPDEAEGGQPDEAEGGQPDGAEGDQPDGAEGEQLDGAEGDQPDGEEGDRPDMNEDDQINAVVRDQDSPDPSPIEEQERSHSDNDDDTAHVENDDDTAHAIVDRKQAKREKLHRKQEEAAAVKATSIWADDQEQDQDQEDAVQTDRPAEQSVVAAAASSSSTVVAANLLKYADHFTHCGPDGKNSEGQSCTEWVNRLPNKLKDLETVLLDGRTVGPDVLDGDKSSFDGEPLAPSGGLVGDTMVYRRDSATPSTPSPAALMETAVRQHVLMGLAGEQWTSSPELDELRNVEGRSTSHVVSIPGGDLGGFLRAISVFERLGGGGRGVDGTAATLDDAAVERLMATYILSSEKKAFATQIDQELLYTLCRTIKFCHPAHRLDRPPPYLMTGLLNALLHAENQGSIYFTNLINYPTRREMNVRLNLTRSVLKAFFRLLWGTPQHRVLAPLDVRTIQSRLKVVVPFGPQPPVALMLQVRTDQCDRRVPRLAPSIADQSIALYYVDVSRAYHAHLAAWLAQYARDLQASDLRAYDAPQMTKLINQLESQQLIASLTLDAGNTTIFSVNIPPSCCA